MTNENLINDSTDERISQALTFEFDADHLPDPPESTLIVDQLRWAVCVLPSDHAKLPLISSLFSHALNRGGLTDRQAAMFSRVYGKILDDFWAEDFGS